MISDTFSSKPDSFGQKHRLKAAAEQCHLNISELGLPEQIKIQEKINQGGMGAIYKAFDETCNEYRAIKVLLPQYARDEKYLARFMREARTARKLHNPHLVTIYSADCSSAGLPYIVMEFVDGLTLAEYLEDHNLSPNEVEKFSCKQLKVYLMPTKMASFTET